MYRETEECTAFTSSSTNISSDPDFQQLEQTVNEYARKSHDWYRQKKRIPRRFYYLSGAMVVVLSALIPLLSAYEGTYFRLTVGIIGVVVSVTTGFNTFFRWEKTWHSFAAAQFDLEYMLRRWEIRMHQAKGDANREESLKLAREATESILEETRTLRQAETEGFFRNLRKPKQ